MTGITEADQDSHAWAAGWAARDQEARTETAKLEAEIQRLRDVCDTWQTTNTHLRAELAEARRWAFPPGGGMDSFVRLLDEAATDAAP